MPEVSGITRIRVRHVPIQKVLGKLTNIFGSIPGRNVDLETYVVPYRDGNFPVVCKILSMIKSDKF